MVITKNGPPCAVLMPITKKTDLEVLALSQNKRFWRLYDAAIEKANKGMEPARRSLKRRQ
jgi:hypothetical protein